MPFPYDARSHHPQPRPVRALRGIPTALLLLMATAPVAAQPAAPSLNSGSTAGPVQIMIQTVNGEVQCGPRTVRLPPGEVLSVSAVNRAERPIWFVAPKFFAATTHIESAGFAYDLTKGGFLVAPESTVRVQVVTPPPGEYYFSCFERTEVPSVQSSGFLLVAPAAR